MFSAGINWMFTVLAVLMLNDILELLIKCFLVLRLCTKLVLSVIHYWIIIFAVCCYWLPNDKHVISIPICDQIWNGTVQKETLTNAHGFTKKFNFNCPNILLLQISVTQLPLQLVRHHTRMAGGRDYLTSLLPLLLNQGNSRFPLLLRVVFVPFVSTSVSTFIKGSSLAFLGVHKLVPGYSGHLKSPDET